MRRMIFIALSLLCFISIAEIRYSNVGAKHIECIEGVKDIPSASTYVQDGLVAMWDGIENAGYGQHDDNLSYWKDLNGNHDLVLSGYGISSGRLIWKDDGLWHIGPNTDGRQSFSIGDIIGDASSFTISYCVSFERIVPALPRYAPLGNSTGSFGFYHNEENFFVSMPWPTGFSHIQLQLQDNTIEATITCDGTYVSGFVNGEKFSNKLCGDTTSFLTKQLYMFYSPGYNPTVDNSWICTIHRILVYDRCINEHEEYKNYTIDKERFNLQ